MGAPLETRTDRGDEPRLDRPLRDTEQLAPPPQSSPRKRGIQSFRRRALDQHWTPAFAGVTMWLVPASSRIPPSLSSPRKRGSSPSAAAPSTSAGPPLSRG